MNTTTTVSKRPMDMRSGDVLVGDSGGRCTVYDREFSSVMPGMVTVETEHGHLYLDPDMEYQILDDSADTAAPVALDEPMTVEQIKANINDEGVISGVGAVDLDDMVSNDFDGFLDTLAERLIGSPCLLDIDYRVVGVSDDQTILVKVTGEASLALA